MSGDSHREDLFHPIKTRGRRRWVYFLPLFGVPNCARLVFVVSVSAERRKRRRRSWLPSNEAYFLRVTDRRRHWRRTEQRKTPTLEFGLWTVQKHWQRFDCHRTISTIQRCISPVSSANILQCSSSSNERLVLTFSSLFILFKFFAGSARNSFASLINRFNELRIARRSSLTGECLSLSYRSIPDSSPIARDDTVEQCPQAFLRASSSCRSLLRKQWGVSPLLTDSKHKPNVNWNILERERDTTLPWFRREAFVTRAVGDIQSVGHHVRSAFSEYFHRFVMAEHCRQIETGTCLIISNLKKMMLLNGFETQILDSLRWNSQKFSEIRLIASRRTIEEILRQLRNVDLLDQSSTILSTFLTVERNERIGWEKISRLLSSCLWQ